MLRNPETDWFYYFILLFYLGKCGIRNSSAGGGWGQAQIAVAVSAESKGRFAWRAHRRQSSGMRLFCVKLPMAIAFLG
jgi:hypothetical protein